jgi:hypothetical protein
MPDVEGPKIVVESIVQERIIDGEVIRLLTAVGLGYRRRPFGSPLRPFGRRPWGGPPVRGRSVERRGGYV